MTTPNSTDAQTTETTATPTLGELSFSDYERARRTGEMPKVEVKPSAPVEQTEQKESSESDTEETAAKKSDAKDETDADEASEESEETEGTEKDEKPKKKGGFQRRIDKLNARYTEERQRREALEQRLAQLERAGDPAKADQVEQPKASQDGKPSPDQFDTHEAYIDALTDWKIEAREKVAKEQAEKARVMTEQQQAMKAHAERVKSFAEKTPDWEEKLSEIDDVIFSATAQQLLVESELGPDLIYALANDRKEAERIASLSPTAVAKEIGKLEAKIAARAAEAQEKPEPKKLTRAPKPIEPVGSSKGAVAKSIDDPNLSFDEYEKLRREQLRKRRA